MRKLCRLFGTDSHTSMILPQGLIPTCGNLRNPLLQRCQPKRKDLQIRQGQEQLTPGKNGLENLSCRQGPFPLGGCADGLDMKDWLAAEAELRRSTLAQVLNRTAGSFRFGKEERSDYARFSRRDIRLPRCLPLLKETPGRPVSIDVQELIRPTRIANPRYGAAPAFPDMGTHAENASQNSSLPFVEGSLGWSIPIYSGALHWLCVA